MMRSIVRILGRRREQTRERGRAEYVFDGTSSSHAMIGVMAGSEQVNEVEV